jgi:hypothetical protein
MTNIKESTINYLLANSSIDPDTGCWNWTGPVTKDGYGQIGPQAIMDEYNIKGAHRLSKHIFHDWTPESRHEHIRHQCHNRGCINPDHHLTGTAADNAADAMAAGRYKRARGEDNPNARLSEEDIRAIRAERKAGVPGLVLAERYKISVTYVSKIKCGRARPEA